MPEKVSDTIFLDARRECPNFFGASVLLPFCFRFASVMQVKLMSHKFAVRKNLDTFLDSFRSASVLLPFCFRYAGKVQLFSHFDWDTAPKKVMKKLEEECPTKLPKVSEK